MKKTNHIRCVLIDIGGVLLSNGWDRHARQKAANHFSLNLSEINELHQLNVDVYEIGKLTLKDYLQRVIFYEKRHFSVEDFQAFMFAQSTPITNMLELITQLKHQYGLKIIALSNEGREINSHRIHTFNFRKLSIFLCHLAS